MNYITANEEKSLIDFGRQGEAGVTTIRFDKIEGFTTASGNIKRNGDTTYHAITLSEAERYYEFVVPAYETAKYGYGKIQIIYQGENTIKKTAVWDFAVKKSLDGGSTEGLT